MTKTAILEERGKHSRGKQIMEGEGLVMGVGGLSEEMEIVI